MSRAALPSKALGETQTLTFDFVSRLAAGETLSTASCTASVYSGTDASPTAVISGSSTISGTKVTQKVTGGILGVVYEVVCTVTTSATQTLELIGYLAIVPDLV